MRLTLREWTHVERSERAFVHFEASRSPGAQYAMSSPRADVPAEVEVVVTYVSDGTRYRRECDGGRGAEQAVYDGEHTWTWAPDAGAVVYEESAAPGNERDLLDPTILITSFDLEPAGAETVAGRRAVAVLARPRASGWDAPGLGLGAEEVELAVDRERGVVLRSEARFGGAAFRVLEVLEIAFDVEIPAETFVLEPPAGEPVRPVGEVYRFDRLPIEEVAGRASFTVLIPDGLAPPWQLHAIHRPASERPELPEIVHLLYFDDALHNFSIEESAAPLLAWRALEPRLVERDGRTLEVLDGAPLEVRAELDGTHFRLSSQTLDADRLVELAASLVAAPTEPPPLF